MFFIVLSMYKNIISNASHTFTAVEDLFHHMLESILHTGKSPGETNKAESSPWYVEGGKE